MLKQQEYKTAMGIPAGHVVFIAILNMLIRTVACYTSWGNTAVYGSHVDASTYRILLPDPDLTASAPGYLYELSVFLMAPSDSLRVVVLRSSKSPGSYSLYSMSDVIRISGARNSSRTVSLPEPLAYERGHVVAFVVSKAVPFPYKLRSPCRFYSRTLYANVMGSLTATADVNLTRLSECRVYSYQGTAITKGRFPEECIPITLSGTLRKRYVGVSSTRTYGRTMGNFYDSNMDMCWRVSSRDLKDQSHVIVLSVISHEVHEGSHLHIYKHLDVDPIMRLSGQTTSGSPLRISKAHGFYIHFKTNSSEVLGGFRLAIHIEDIDNDGARLKVAVICLSALCASFLLVLTVACVVRCRKRQLKADEESRRESESHVEQTVESGALGPRDYVDSLTMPSGSESDGRIPHVGYKTDGTFLKSVAGSPVLTMLANYFAALDAAEQPSTNNNSGKISNGAPSTCADDEQLSAGEVSADVENNAIHALDVAIDDSAHAPSTQRDMSTQDTSTQRDTTTQRQQTPTQQDTSTKRQHTPTQDTGQNRQSSGHVEDVSLCDADRATDDNKQSDIKGGGSSFKGTKTQRT